MFSNTLYDNYDDNLIDIKNDLQERFPYFLTNANTLLLIDNGDINLDYSKKYVENFSDYFHNELHVTYSIIRNYSSTLTEKEWLLFCLQTTIF